MPIQDAQGGGGSGQRGPLLHDGSGGGGGSDMIGVQDRAPCDVFINVNIVCVILNRRTKYVLTVRLSEVLYARCQNHYILLYLQLRRTSKYVLTKLFAPLCRTCLCLSTPGHRSVLDWAMHIWGQVSLQAHHARTAGDGEWLVVFGVETIYRGIQRCGTVLFTVIGRRVNFDGGSSRDRYFVAFFQGKRSPSLCFV